MYLNLRLGLLDCLIDVFLKAERIFYLNLELLENGKSAQIGVESCLVYPDYPGVYARVTAVKVWIKGIATCKFGSDIENFSQLSKKHLVETGSGLISRMPLKGSRADSEVISTGNTKN